MNLDTATRIQIYEDTSVSRGCGFFLLKQVSSFKKNPNKSVSTKETARCFLLILNTKMGEKHQMGYKRYD